MDGPLARHLTRFSPPRSPGRAAAPPFGRSSGERPAAPLDEERVTLTAEALAVRLAAARAEAAAETEAVFTTRLSEIEAARAADAAAQAAAVEAALREAEAAWNAGAAATLSGQVDAAMAALRQQLAGGLADALRPLLAEAAADRALEALAAALDRLLADPARPAVLVRGPAGLVAALRALRGTAPDKARGVTFEEVAPGEASEVVMTADGAHVETRLALALASLTEACDPVKAGEEAAPR